MTEFYKNYLRLCAKKKQSPSGAAKAAGFSNSTATGWSHDNIPSEHSLTKLCLYFDCSREDLMGKFEDEGITSKIKTATAPKGGGLLEEFGRIFDTLTPANQNAIIAEMLRRQREQ